MTNKFTQTPDTQDPNAIQWMAPRSGDPTLAPKDEAAKDEDDDLDEDEDEDEFDEDEDEDEDSEEKEEGDETA